MHTASFPGLILPLCDEILTMGPSLTGLSRTCDPVYLAPMKTLATFICTLALFTVTAVADDSKFFGTWDTNWGLLVIKQGEDKITGKYTGQFEGTIEGAVKDGKLQVIWKQPNGEWGSAVFTVSEDGKKLTGTWGGMKSATDGGEWNGTRE